MDGNRSDLWKVQEERPPTHDAEKIISTENTAVGWRREQSRAEVLGGFEHFRVVIAEHRLIATLDPQLHASICGRTFARQIAEGDHHVVFGGGHSRKQLAQFIEATMNIPNKDMASRHLTFHAVFTSHTSGSSISGVYGLLGQDATLQWNGIVVEQPVFNELRLIVLGADFLRLTGTDFVA